MSVEYTVFSIQAHTLNRKIFTPFYFHLFHPHFQKANLRLGEFKIIFKNIKRCLFHRVCILNSVWANSNGTKVKTNCKCRRAKINKKHRAKVTLYTVINRARVITISMNLILITKFSNKIMNYHIQINR